MSGEAITGAAEEMITILLTQAAFTSAAPPPIVRDFWTAANGVIG